VHAIGIDAATRGLPGAMAVAAAMHGFLRTQGHWDQGLAIHRGALGVARQMSDIHAQAAALTDLGDMQYMTGDYTSAAESLTRALEISRDRGSSLGEAAALQILSFVQYETGDSGAATIGLARALECFRELGNRVEEANALGYLAVMQQATGDYEAAIANQTRALVLHRDLGNRFGEANALNFLGAVQQAAGDYRAAAANQLVKSARGAVPVFRPARFPGAASRTGHATWHRTRLSTSPEGSVVVVVLILWRPRGRG
jgi:tetratricopeptide (TPR) repeat protein